ncbi:MAG: response regulator transcription factor [Lachnospiraceae bacterium]|nr:response regulator transcription factor [Lachnospiraceae bacterium]
MKIAIIDDDMKWREKAEKIICQYFNDDEIQIDVFQDGLQYLEKQTKYDVSFVDIEMPILDGFMTIERAREYNKDGIFIILTTHTEMSRKGYLVNAFRYIDKLRIVEEIRESLDSVEILLNRKEKILLNVIGEGKREICLKDIIYIETEKHWIIVHTNSKRIKCRDNMSDIEHILANRWFYRCHKSFIVNLDEIERIENYIIYLNNGDDVDIARRKVPAFKRAYLSRQYECGNA